MSELQTSKNQTIQIDFPEQRDSLPSREFINEQSKTARFENFLEDLLQLPNTLSGLVFESLFTLCLSAFISSCWHYLPLPIAIRVIYLFLLLLLIFLLWIASRYQKLALAISLRISIILTGVIIGG